MKRNIFLIWVWMGLCFPISLYPVKLSTINHIDTTANEVRRIVEVATVNVKSPQGTIPRLPFQVWVTYSDGTSEFRQTKWYNTSLTIEQEQIQFSEGKEYEINGVIIGDNTTIHGYPIVAHVKVVNEMYDTPSNHPLAEPLPLDKVSLTGNNRLTSNRELAIKAILSWDVSQQLYNYRDTYGLSTDGYVVADGWDSPTTKLKGHGSGHYMSALAFAFASSVDPKQKEQLRKNIARMVNELRECQERTFVWNEELGRYWEARDFAKESELMKMEGDWSAYENYKKEYTQYGYGYLNAIPAHHAVMIEKYAPYNNEKGVWAPYYAIHKQLAGLIDIANYVDDKEIAGKALLIAKDMGLWIWNRLHYRTFVQKYGTMEERRVRPGNRYEMWNMYIAGEVGGIGESLARLSDMVIDETEKEHLLEASNYFDSPAFFEPLAKNSDDIRTRHANQHIPMIIAALRSYRYNNNPAYYNLSENFWNLLQGRYIYSTGGVGNGEMFRQPYTQIMSMNNNVSVDRNRNIRPNPNINETCCVYNLAKLSKELNCFNPDNAAYMDYYERVLYNQLVGSLHPTHYMTTYHYAVGLDASKQWGNSTPGMSCCGGTGSENHVKYQEAAYFVSNNTLWVSLYLPSTAQWDAKNITIQQDCLWPAEKTTIKVLKGKGKFSMKLRVPYWATRGFDVKLNGKSVAKSYQPCSYVTIPKRKWSEKDVVEVIMPFTKHINYGPDKMEIAATGLNETNTVFTPMWVGTLMYGPLAMAVTGVNHWNKAVLKINSDLSNVKMNGASEEIGTNGNLYTLFVDNLLFQPDYFVDKHSTHYFRIKQNDGSVEWMVDQVVDKSKLGEVIQIAKERIKAQEKWNHLAVKIPEYAPWAPHGYSRLLAKYETAVQINDNKEAIQDEINTITAALNAAINSMRPGNLAELEDLNELFRLMREVKSNGNINPQTKDVMDYVDSVVDYVGDGSGTIDMINKACEKMKALLNFDK